MINEVQEAALALAFSHLVSEGPADWCTIADLAANAAALIHAPQDAPELTVDSLSVGHASVS